MPDGGIIPTPSPKKQRQSSQKASRSNSAKKRGRTSQKATRAKSAKAKALANSRPLCLQRWSDYPEADRAVELVVEQIRARRSLTWDIQAIHKTALKVIILDLYAAWVHDKRRYLAYSRDAGYYKVSSIYNSLDIGYRPLRKVVDALKSLHYISSERGFFDPVSKTGRRSRMRAKPRLIDMVETQAGLRPEMLERDPNEEVIVLKDRKDKHGKKPRIEHKDTPDTIILRTHVRLVNDFIARHVIDLFITDQAMDTLAKDLRRDRDKYPVDFTRTRLKRIFNNESFKEGGRFYGGWWLEIPKGYREHILINGKRTIEIDYGALHPRLLYAQAGINYPATKDPYDVPKAGVPRDVIKRIFNILLNAENHAEAIGAMKGKYPMYSEQQLLETVEAIKQVHQPIVRHLHSGIGIKLQYLDSVLAQEIILYMMEEHGVLVLPVHDSFIVRVGFEDELRDVMEELFQGMFTSKPVLKPDPELIKDPDEEPDDATSVAAELKIDRTWLEEYFDEYAKQIERDEWLRKRAERHISKGPLTPIIHTKW